MHTTHSPYTSPERLLPDTLVRELPGGPTAREATRLSRARDPQAQDTPRVLGAYRLVRLIGEGAAGRVYEAERIGLGRAVALKLLRTELAQDHDFLQRVFAEARAANRVHSDHVVEVSDVCFEPTGEVFLIMDLLRGRDFAAARVAGSLNLLDSLGVLRQLVETMAHVHAAGIIHRDLKPENIFLTERDGQCFVKVIDFGVAKVQDDDGTSLTATLPGMVVGTPQYMAPEQTTADSVDERCDIHAIGVMLFEVLTGQLPFQADTLRELLRSIASTPPPRVSGYVTLPHPIATLADRMVAQCLRKDPAGRPSASRLLVYVDALIAGIEATPEASGVRQATPARAFHQIRAAEVPTICLRRPQSCGWKRVALPLLAFCALTASTAVFAPWLHQRLHPAARAPNGLESAQDRGAAIGASMDLLQRSPAGRQSALLRDWLLNTDEAGRHAPQTPNP